MSVPRNSPRTSPPGAAGRRPISRRSLGAALMGVVPVAAAACTEPPADATRGTATPPQERTLLWEENFEGAAGTFPDQDSWTAEIGGGGWGNDELQTYTDAPTNVALDGGGHLVITARQEAFGDDATWTSARVTTFGKRLVRYGRIEVRAKVPRGTGVWPAAWTLGGNIQQVGWPACGEIDIIESIGDGTTALQTVHGARLDGQRWLQTLETPRESPLSDDFHVYAVDWNSDRVEFSLDGQATGRFDHSSLTADQTWPFDAAQYLLLNVAIGGRLPGPPDDTTPSTVSMIVDWVRTYS